MSASAIRPRRNLGVRMMWFLFASVGPMLLSIVSIPLTTYKLSAEDFGLFSLVTSLTALGPAIAGLGSSYLMANGFVGASHENQVRTVSSLFWSGMAVIISLSALMLLLRFFWERWVPEVALLPARCLMWALIAMCAAYPWSIAMDYLTLTAESRLFAAIALGQALAGTSATLVLLYGVDLGSEALFAGSALGSVIGALLSLWSLRRHLRLTWSRSVGREQLRLGGPLALGGLAEALQGAIERHLIARVTGLASVGIYAHAIGYRRIVFMLTKSLSRTVWPETLAEAREPSLSFPRTRRAWLWAYAGLTAVGIGLALWGADIIGWLTHEKFRAAAPLTAGWMAFLLIQYSGRTQTGYLFAHGKGISYAICATFAAVAAIILLFFTVPFWGLWGAVVAALLAQIGLRVGVHVACHRLVRLSFDDLPTLAGAMLIGACLFIAHHSEPSQAGRTIIAFTALGLFAFCFMRERRRTRMDASPEESCFDKGVLANERVG